MKTLIPTNHNVCGFDFDPSKMLYVPEKYEDAIKIIKSVKNINAHVGHNALYPGVQARFRDALFTNTDWAMDNLHPTSFGPVVNSDYDGEDGIVLHEHDGTTYICDTDVSYTGNYYKDIKFLFDNSSGDAIPIESMTMGSNGLFFGDVYTYATILFYYIEIGEWFTIGAYRTHYGYWKVGVTSSAV